MYLFLSQPKIIMSIYLTQKMILVSLLILFALSLINNFAVYNKEIGQEIEVEQTLEDKIYELIEKMKIFQLQH